MAEASKMFTLIGSSIITLAGLSVFMMIATQIGNASEGVDESRQVTTLAGGINSTCENGGNEGVTLNLESKQVKLQNKQIYVKDRDEDSSEYKERAKVKCSLGQNKKVIPEGESPRSSFSFIIEKRGDNYAVGTS